MSEKFRDVVNAPHRGVGRLGKKIKNTKPEKTIGKIARGGGIITTATVQFLLWLTKYVALDNHVTRAVERGFAKVKVGKTETGKDKKFPKFIKTHPNFTSIVSWWMMLASLVGGYKIAENKDEILNSVKDKIEKVKIKFSKSEDDTDNEVAQKTYSTKSSSFKKDVVNENWSEIVIGLLEFETYHTVPKKQSGEKRYTYGPGLTWVYENGQQKECNGAYVDKVKDFSDADVWDQVRQHCLYNTEVLGVAKKQLEKHGFDTVTDQQIMGLLFAGYQTPASLGYPMAPKLDKNGNVIKNKQGKVIKESIPGIIPKLQEAGDDIQKIVDAFIAGRDVNKTWREGTNKRRWWCAMYYIGKIRAADLLIMDRDAFSKIDINVVMKDGHFVYDDAIIQYALDSKKPGVGTVQDFITAHEGIIGIGQKVNSGVQSEAKQQERQDTVKEKTFIMDYDTAYTVASDAYRSGDYESAAKQFEELVADNPDSALLHNHLADIYNHLGRYDDAIRHASDIVKRIGDKSQYATAQYNAGIAYENLGKLDKALANYKLSLKNGNKYAKLSIKRIEEKLDSSKAKAFKDASQRIKKDGVLKRFKIDERDE